MPDAGRTQVIKAEILTCTGNCDGEQQEKRHVEHSQLIELLLGGNLGQAPALFGVWMFEIASSAVPVLTPGFA